MIRNRHHTCLGAMLICLASISSIFAYVLDLPQQKEHAVSSSSPKSSLSAPTYIVSSFTIDQIQSGQHDDELKNILTTSGLFTISVPLQHHYEEQDHELVQGLCHCRDKHHVNKFNQIPNGDIQLLSDGLTTRSTIATATRGITPLSLPKADIQAYCGEGVHESLEEARDYVSSAVSEGFIPALDRLILQEQDKGYLDHTSSLMKTKTNKHYNTMSSIIKDANHLEHFHLYSKEKSTTHDDSIMATSIDDALGWHTDAGLFLAFTPGKSCNKDDTNDDSFRIALPDNRDKNKGSFSEMKVKFPTEKKDETLVAIMLGAGAEHWLKTPSSLGLRATKHAVKMKSGDTRAWYGMMHLVPAQAIVQDEPAPQTFAEMKQSFVHSTSRKFGDDSTDNAVNNVVIGCGPSSSNDNSPRPEDNHSGYSVTTSRRRLQHVGGNEDCEGSGNFFCWLSCLEVPNDGRSFEDHFNDGESMYCLDQSILYDTKNLTLAVQSCSDHLDIAGGVMDEGCSNYWYPTVEGVQSYLQSDSYSGPNGEKKYCYSSTAMYMQGFQWEGKICLVYLFSSWVISERGFLVLACFGTIALGMVIEYLIGSRGKIVRYYCETRNEKLIVGASLYAIQITLGYSIMLIVMTYSGPLVISVIIGLVLGHVVVNWRRNKGKQGKVENMGDEKIEEGDDQINGITPCCRS
mmetsp:Transcript_473/g.666  ORF Transcript_473/g.666 Transcript_473/m.666 type:complete len:686 (+) Transcript_473:135-2192(+)